MRVSDSGLAHGTSGSPQTIIESSEYAAKVAENERKLKEIAERSMIDESLIKELEANGVKFYYIYGKSGDSLITPGQIPSFCKSA